MRWSIRELLLLTTVVALAIGWWLEHRRHEATRRDYQRSYAAVDGLVDMLRMHGIRVQLEPESVRIETVGKLRSERWGGRADYHGRSNPFANLQSSPRVVPSGSSEVHIALFPAVLLLLVIGAGMTSLFIWRRARRSSIVLKSDN